MTNKSKKIIIPIFIGYLLIAFIPRFLHGYIDEDVFATLMKISRASHLILFFIFFKLYDFDKNIDGDKLINKKWVRITIGTIGALLLLMSYLFSSTMNVTWRALLFELPGALLLWGLIFTNSKNQET